MSEGYNFEVRTVRVLSEFRNVKLYPADIQVGGIMNQSPKISFITEFLSFNIFEPRVILQRLTPS